MCILTDIADCPLYIESHVCSGLGCVKYMDEPCLVSQGKMNFQQALLKLAAIGRDYPGIVQLIETKGAA